MSGIYCKACGYTGKPKYDTQGSFLIELILWCTFIVPGLVYSLWRMSSKKQICPLCKSTDLIPLNSPIAKQMLKGAKL